MKEFYFFFFFSLTLRQKKKLKQISYHFYLALYFRPGPVSSTFIWDFLLLLSPSLALILKKNFPSRPVCLLVHPVPSSCILCMCLCTQLSVPLKTVSPSLSFLLLCIYIRPLLIWAVCFFFFFLWSQFDFILPVLSSSPITFSTSHHAVGLSHRDRC